MATVNPRIHWPRLSLADSLAIITFAALLAANIYIRLMPAKYGVYLNEFDPFYHYYATSVLVSFLQQYGLSGIGKFFSYVSPYFWYPWGRHIATTSPDGLYFFTATLYLLVSGIGLKISLYNFVVVLPIFEGIIALIPMYFIVKSLTGNKYIGLLVAVLSLGIPGLITRTDFGWYKGTPLDFLLMPLAFMLLIYAFDKDKYPYALSLLAGLVVGYSYTVWGGAENINGVIGLAFLAAPLLIKISRKTISLELLYTIGAMVAAIFPDPGRSWIYSATMLLLYLSLILNALAYINQEKKIMPQPALYAILFVLGIGGLAGIAYFLPKLVNLRYLSVIDLFIRTKPSVVSTVAEQLPVSGLELDFMYGFGALLTALGGYYLIKKKTIGSLATAILLIWSFYIGSAFGELLDFIGMAIIIGAPIGVYYVYTSIAPAPAAARPVKKKARQPAPKGPSIGYRAEKYAAAAFLISLAAVPIYYWYPANNSPVTIANSATILNGYVPAWIDALKWMSNSSNMPPHSVVVAWWDYGYWITVMGNQTTVVDNATLNGTQIGLVAKMFLSPPNQAIHYFKMLHGQYVVVFATGAYANLLTGDQYLQGYQLSGELYGIGGDESKVSAMLVWAGWTNNESVWINKSTGLLTPYFWNDTLLGRLEPLQYLGWAQIDPSTGQVVGITQNQLNNTGLYQLPVWAYNIYYGTNSTPFRLVYASPLSITSNGIWAQVLIYEYVGNSTPAAS